MKICILYGGTSSERAVSLNTGKSIYDAICNEYEVTMYDFNGNYDLLLENVENVDLIFNALHGGSGEDGTMQKYLESKDIKFTGSASEASKKAMDKNVSKILCSKHGVTTPSWEIVDVRAIPQVSKGLYIANTVPYFFIDVEDQDYDKQKLYEEFNCDLDGSNGVVVKPCNEGSSVGVSILNYKFNNRTEISHSRLLIDSLFKISEMSDYFMIEQFIAGRELTVSILDDKVLPIVEIIPKGDYYDYKSKYTKFQSEYVVPAEIDKNTQELLSAYSLKIHKLIGCGSYSRIDFRLSEDNEVYFLELNTLPGFTDTSLFPKSAKAAGLEYKDLIKKIIEIT